MSEQVPVLAQATARKIHFQGRAVRVLAVLGLVLAGLVTLLLIGVDVGPVAFATGLVLATVPVPIYVFLALRIDRFEPEPLRLLAWAFFWGASASTLIALILNTAGQAIVGAHFGSDVGEIYGGSISAPIVEESAKGFVLFLIYRWRRWQLDGVLDGMVYAAMVGLGFATTENVLYYSHAAVDGGVPLAATFFMRGVLAPFTHPVFTCMTGIGFGLAVTTKRRWVRVLAPPGGPAHGDLAAQPVEHVGDGRRRRRVRGRLLPHHGPGLLRPRERGARVDEQGGEGGGRAPAPGDRGGHPDRGRRRAPLVPARPPARPQGGQARRPRPPCGR